MYSLGPELSGPSTAIYSSKILFLSGLSDGINQRIPESISLATPSQLVPNWEKLGLNSIDKPIFFKLANKASNSNFVKSPPISV